MKLSKSIKPSVVAVGLVTLLVTGSAIAESKFIKNHGGGFQKNGMQGDMHSGRYEMEHGGGMPGAKMMRHVFAMLDLSEEQEASLKALKEANKATVQGIHTHLKTFKMQMPDLINAESTDETAIKNLSLQIAEKKAELLILHAKLRKEALALLTDEQRANFDRIVEKMKKRQQGRNASNS